VPHKLHNFLLLTLLLSLCSAAWGQGVGTINGIITDPSGASVPNATVTVTETETGLVRSVTTADNGLYTFSSLRPTVYSLKVEAVGFQQVNQAAIVLQANQSLTMNLKLALGSTSEIVDVNADAVSVDTSSSTVSNVIDSARIAELPLNGRNAAQLTTLVPGSVIAPPEDADEGVTKTFPVAITVSTNGGRSNEVSYFLDGVPNTDFLSNVNLPFPMPDALQEFSVQTSNYTAEFGESSGAVVNIVTQSGTNKIHGSGFDYIRNGYFNAANRFATDVDPLHRQQFGGTLGGPIKKDKLFFFFGYQGTRLGDVAGGKSATVPTAAQINGDFSNLPAGSLKNTSTGLPYANNYIDPSTFDPASVAVLKYLPATTGSGQISYAVPLKQTLNEYTAKGDWAINDNDRLTARYFYDRFVQAAQFVPGNALTYSDFAQFADQNVAINETHIFNTNLLNEFRFGFEHLSDRRGPPANTPTFAQFGVNIPQGVVPAIEQLSVSSYFRFGSFPQGEFPRHGLTWSDSLRWQVGRHSFVFGGSYERDSLYEFAATNQNGIFTFTGSKTGLSTGNSLADFLLGHVQSFTQATGYVQDNRYSMPALFMQDSFRANARLTVNYGVRWSPALPWHDKYHEAESFSPANYASGTGSIVYPNAPAGMIFPGDPGFVHPDGPPANWYDFAPRAGVAWDVFGNGKTSLRGGVGEFFDSRTPGFANQRQSQATPFTLAVTLTQPAGGFSNPYLGQVNPFPGPLPPPKTIVFPSPVLVYSYNQNEGRIGPNTTNGNITLEQQMPGNALLRVAGVFARTSHLNATMQLNPSIYIPGSKLSAQARRPYQGFAQIYENTNSASSRYKALQLTLQKRLSNKFQISGNYTLSSSVDNVPNGTDAVSLDVGSTYAIPASMPNFRALDTGPSEFDRRHHLSVSYLWVLPTFAGRNGFVRNVLGGWSLSGITTIQTGAPLTILSGGDNSSSNIGFDRAVPTGQPVYASSRACSGNCESYLNASAFATNAPGTFGSVGRGAYRGPGYDNWDMSITRNFPVSERAQIRFRAEYFNVFNHPNLLDPAVSLANSASFGTITTANDPRIAQFALKILF
jgi:hypothetical protein